MKSAEEISKIAKKKNVAKYVKISQKSKKGYKFRVFSFFIISHEIFSNPLISSI